MRRQVTGQPLQTIDEVAEPDQLGQEPRHVRQRNHIRSVAQGAVGIGPVKDEAELAAALKEGIEQVRGGALCLIDVHVAAEYSRATSSAVLRTIPAR